MAAAARAALANRNKDAEDIVEKTDEELLEELQREEDERALGLDEEGAPSFGGPCGPYLRLAAAAQALTIGRCVVAMRRRGEEGQRKAGIGRVVAGLHQSATQERQRRRACARCAETCVLCMSRDRGRARGRESVR